MANANEDEDQDTVEWSVEACVERGKREIVVDVRLGRVPGSIESFAKLHDYVDANDYGELSNNDAPWWDGTDEEVETQVCAIGNVVQNQLHQWLASGQMRRDRLKWANEELTRLSGEVMSPAWKEAWNEVGRAGVAVYMARPIEGEKTVG